MVSCSNGTRLEIPSDAELLQSLGAREPAALEHLYDRHARYALGIASRILGDREEAGPIRPPAGASGGAMAGWEGSGLVDSGPRGAP